MEQDAFKNITVFWDDAHKYSPAPRHRRRIIHGLLRKLEFETCLDAGCAQPHFLAGLQAQGKKVFGCDISDQVVASNRERLPQAGFEIVDIAKNVYPGNQRFDLVISSEVLEHIQEWQAALANLCRMSSRYLLITVPRGKVHRIDQIIGHRRHFSGPELAAAIEQQGFSVLTCRFWGFPLHSLYKILINGIAPEQIYASYGAGKYGFFQKLVSQILYGLFFFNDFFHSGQQLIILARRNAV
jgi:SAM-dependent methyltransferase